MKAFKLPSPPPRAWRGGGMMIKRVDVKRETVKRGTVIRLLTYDLFSLNFPVSDYLLIPSYTYPYDYHVKIRIAMRCVEPEIYSNFAELIFNQNRVVIMQGRDLEIKISVVNLDMLPSIAKYLLKLIHVLCYERPP
jgi:hypothetical protein